MMVVQKQKNQDEISEEAKSRSITTQPQFDNVYNKDSFFLAHQLSMNPLPPPLSMPLFVFVELSAEVFMLFIFALAALANICSGLKLAFG
ncbi:unnamed protein product [Ambrosiozyma monospora]|uniref:Unnamed protein product n=1 Tax=Ambrosiozyma monospora TaxID=43982 RepID=A0ACB5TU25_AMBMO|nr:unnamed protein product [Ambrosiozyma monospora]